MHVIRLVRLSTMLILVASLVTSTPAFAAGLNLSWDDCTGEGGRVQNKQFACDTNLGSHLLVASLIPSFDVQNVIGSDCVLEMITPYATLPPWWSYHSGCRAGALQSNVDFDPSDVVCEDWTLGQASQVSQVFLPNGIPGTGRLTMGVLVPGLGTSDPVPQVMLAGHEYFLRNIIITNQKTTDPGCSGCTAPVCLLLSYGTIIYCDPAIGPDCFAADPVRFTTPHAPASNVVTFQGLGAGPFAPACIAATPTQRATWGAVKALYR